MNQFNLAYSIATENHGILTAAEARRNGIASKTLARWVRIGRFVKCGNGVYRATQYPFSEEDQYAIAVAQCGKEAYLCGESVLGLLRLMPVNVDRISIRAPRYLEALGAHGAGVRDLDIRAEMELLLMLTGTCNHRGVTG